VAWLGNIQKQTSLRKQVDLQVRFSIGLNTETIVMQKDVVATLSYDIIFQHDAPYVI